jgi:hypothetical protein
MVKLLAITTVALAASVGDAQSLQTIQIGSSSYHAGNPMELTSYIPNKYVQLALSAINRCKAMQVTGFWSTQTASGGVVAWAPTDVLACFERDSRVMGGGPGGCTHLYRTPAEQDPTKISGRNWPEYFVLLAATNAQACADLSTQVPGGVWGKTTAPAQGLPSGSTVVIKCQRTSGQRILDYVAPYGAPLPISKAAAWIDDESVFTGITTKIPGVPEC